MQEKMNAYIECYNALDGSIHDSISRYTSWVKNFEKGPTGKESVVYGLYEIHQNSTNSCKNNITAALAIKPELKPMDEIAANYLAAAETVSAEINELNRYYDQEDYKDDNFAKGKEHNSKLVAAYKAFEPASKAFSQSISKINNERQQARLDKMEKEEGKSLNYYSLGIMLDAQTINGMIEEESFETEKPLALVSELQSKIENARPLIEEQKKANNMSYMSYESLLRQADSYAKAAKERIRRVRDKEPYSTGEKMNLGTSGEWMVNGSVGKLIKEYNSLVGDYNRL
ncbi:MULTISPECIES: YiiG family protein [Limnobaculum]